MKIPKGWDEIKLAELASTLVGQIEAYKSDTGQIREGWAQVMSVYNDDPENVITAIDWPSGVERPYNVPLLQPKSDALADDLTDNITRSRPMFVNIAKIEDEESEDRVTQVPFVVSGDDIREKTEQAVDFALRRANFEKRVRDAVLSSVLKSRGILRLRHVSVDSEEFLDAPDGMYEDQSGDGKRYVGLYIESFQPEDFVCYPSSVEHISESQTHGHMRNYRLKDIIARSESGEFFEGLDFEDLGGGDVDESVEDSDDASRVCYDLITRIWDENTKTEKLWNVILLADGHKILAMQEFEAPRSWYFAPSIRYQPNSFLATRSLFQKGLEIQTIANDSMTAIVTGSLASALQSAVVWGGTVDQSKIKLGFGEFLQVKGAPLGTMTLGGGQFNPGGLFNVLEYCERSAEMLFRLGAPGMGAFTQQSQTATQASIVAEGQSKGYRSYTSNLALELEPMAELARWYIEKYHDEYLAFYGDLFPAQNMADVEKPAIFELNSRSPNLAPDVTLAKLEKFAGLAGALGVPFDRDRFLDIAANALDLGDVLANKEAISAQLPTAMAGSPAEPAGQVPTIPVGA